MKLIIPGPPIAKMRPKFRCAGKFAHAYDPQAKLAKAMKDELTLLAKYNQSDDFEACYKLPKIVKLWYFQPIAVSDSKARKNAKLDGSITSSKDIDNLIKWTLDICNGVLWHDDAQIVKIFALKKFSENTCTIIEVSTIKNSIRGKNDRDRSFFSFGRYVRYLCRRHRNKKGRR